MYKFRNEQKQSVNQSLFLYQNSTLYDIKTYFKNFGLHEVNDKSLKDTISKHSVAAPEYNTPFGYLSSFVYQNRYYIKLIDKDNTTLFESKEKISADQSVFIVFLIACTLFIWLYIFAIKHVKEIEKFNKSNQAAADLSSLRTLFLRAIMHELKTPIGKGRIVAEMVEDSLSKERLIKVFRRLETLIGEFAKTEQLIKQSYALEKKRYSLSKILDLSFDFLMLEPEQIDRRVVKKLPKKSIYIDADLDSMALAFKNLMDNAIKYGSDGCVTITLQKNTLFFSNKGKPLDKPIADYKKPFISSDDSAKSRMKMGLGLYITESILNLHGLKLNYEYKDSSHYFFINLIAS
ncbi:MAG: ArsS family sensor histidine kinase [Campylobacteraceae bacterium]|nr:ArsS family sensor histidine kinase [Campylobacteraceae bacterium]